MCFSTIHQWKVQSFAFKLANYFCSADTNVDVYIIVFQEYGNVYILFSSDPLGVDTKCKLKAKIFTFFFCKTPPTAKKNISRDAVPLFSKTRLLSMVNISFV